jgi:hypothetical protein
MEEHQEYLVEFNEPSAKICNTDLQRLDRTAVYTFMVRRKDLVFHTHAGHRVISGISGSGGSRWRFSRCRADVAEQNPQEFVDQLFYVDIPPASYFSLRFDGRVYHQFCPGSAGVDGFAAVSCHTDETYGLEHGEILRLVEEGKASIPLLTIPITDKVDEILKLHDEAKVLILNFDRPENVAA